MKKFLSLAAISLSVFSVLLFGACEQQSAAVTAPKYYEKQRAAEAKANQKEPADTNPPTYFNN